VLVAERVGEALHRPRAGDLIARDVQSAVDVGQSERTAGPDQDPERGEAQLAAVEGVGGVRRTPNRFGASDPGAAKAAPAAAAERGPDGVAEAGELGADGGHALGELLILRVDVFRFGDQRGALRDPGFATGRTTSAGLHDGFPSSQVLTGEAGGDATPTL
jgi:hypothetical protein